MKNSAGRGRCYPPRPKAVAFYAAFISVARHRHYMSRFKSTSVEYSYGCDSN